MDINEKTLLYRAQAGSSRAAEILYQRYYREIYTYLYYRIGDKTAAEASCTGVFIRMIRRLPHLNLKKTTFLAWLYDLAREYMEENSRELEPALPGETSTDLPQYRSAREAFVTAMKHLDLDEKELIIHRFVEGRSARDISHLTGLSPREVRRLQRRSLQSLEYALEEENCL